MAKGSAGVAGVVRTASDFSLDKLEKILRYLPRASRSLGGFDLEQIRSMRDAQMIGSFSAAARLSAAMETNDAISTARRNRLAPLRAVRVEMKAASSKAKAAKVAAEAEALYGQGGVALTLDTIHNVRRCKVEHGVAFLTVHARPREDGSRLDLFANYWPIEFVRWDSYRRKLFARVDTAASDPGAFELGPSGYEEEIVHGNGRWIVVRSAEVDPWLEGAIIPAADVWASHAFAKKDWNKGSLAQGNAKLIGQMPDSVPLQEDGGVLSKEAEAFLALMQGLMGDEPVGISPAGCTTKFESVSGTPYQVWKELVDAGNAAAARIYLGTDGTMGSKGGAPGVDITALFGVASTLVQGDFTAEENAFFDGLFKPWCALNFGDSELAPRRVALLPDDDEEREREQRGKRRQAFYADVQQARALGFAVTQDFVDDAAALYDVDAPELPEVATSGTSTIALGVDAVGLVLTVNEGRAAAGKGPLLLPDGSPDPIGNLFIAENAARIQARQEATVKAAPEAAAPAP